MSNWNQVKGAALAVCAGVLAAACGTAQAKETAAPAAEQVMVVARDFAFQAPDQIAAGLVTFTLHNRGSTIHHMAIVRLDDGKTMDDLFNALKAGGPPPLWAHDMGGPNAPDPGADANATVAMQPGNYVLACFVDLPGGVPHIMKGMARALKVTPSGAAPAAVPAGDVTLTLSDYHFALSRPITRGVHTLRVVNTAAQSHEVSLIKLAPGKTANDILAWLQNPQGPPPANAAGGIAGMAHGQVETFTYDFTPGQYALVCFLPAPGDGKRHFEHGMIETITVP